MTSNKPKANNDENRNALKGLLIFILLVVIFGLAIKGGMNDYREKKDFCISEDMIYNDRGDYCIQINNESKIVKKYKMISIQGEYYLG